MTNKSNKGESHCQSTRRYHPSGELWHPCGRDTERLSYRQLHSLRSLAGGYDCFALSGDVTFGTLSTTMI